MCLEGQAFDAFLIQLLAPDYFFLTLRREEGAPPSDRPEDYNREIDYDRYYLGHSFRLLCVPKFYHRPDAPLRASMPSALRQPNCRINNLVQEVKQLVRHGPTHLE